MKKLCFVLAVLALLPFAVVGFIVGLVMCGLRGGYHAAESLARWLTE